MLSYNNNKNLSFWKYW